MNANLNISWKKFYNFILLCGNVHELKAFSVEILSNLRELCNFDQSSIYFLDGNGKVCNQYLMNIDKQWSAMYLEYYSKVENGNYGLERSFRENSAKPAINIRIWGEEPSTEFVTHYIGPRNLKYSLGFALFDINGMPRTVFALDKIRGENFTDDEFMTLCLAVPLLNNLHKNFFCQQTSRQGVDQISWETTNLTDREIEITNLLCQGISPAIISESLYIAKSTTYKHISNIYEKMHVTTLQELLVRLLG